MCSWPPSLTSARRGVPTPPPPYLYPTFVHSQTVGLLPQEKLHDSETSAFPSPGWGFDVRWLLHADAASHTQRDSKFFVHAVFFFQCVKVEALQFATAGVWGLRFRVLITVIIVVIVTLVRAGVGGQVYHPSGTRAWRNPTVEAAPLHAVVFLTYCRRA